MQLKTVLSTVLAFILFAMFALPASAEVTLDDLLKRVEALEQENTALKGEVMALKEKQTAQTQQISEVQAKATSAVASATAAPTAAPSGNFLKTKMDIDLYGFLSLAATYSDSAAATASGTNSSVAATNAPRETIGINQSSFNATAQDTRLGLNLKAPDLDDGGKLSGKFEIDFAGSTNGGVYLPRLRLAYAQLDYPKWGATAGQTWDFFAPLNPNTLNAGLLYRGGNLGTRRPQAYLTNRWGNMLGGKLTTKVGILDSDDPFQENSGAPVLGAYSSFETKVLGKPTTFGVGGIYGTNSTSLLGTKGTNNNTIYATTVGVTMKFADWLSFQSEGFTGAKLDDFFGGSATGITDTTTAELSISKAVRVMGGFVELTYNPTKKIETNYGIGYDGADGKQTIPNLADRQAIWKSNRTYYTNLKYNLSKFLLVGVEYQYFATDYFDGVKGDDNRVQSMLIYKF